jgi:hypothetical protein
MSQGLTPCVLMRAGLQEEPELRTASKYFPVHRLRSQVPANSLVVGRYSVLPYFHELEADLGNAGSVLVNTYEQHRYIANFDYLQDVADTTFPTWFRFEDVPLKLHSCAFVVKGRTNSRKNEWSRKMFAPDFSSAVRVGAELMTDGLIGQQGLVIRQYIPLQTFEIALSGLPLTNEWRIFYYRGRRLAYGYYWSQLEDWSAVDAAKRDFLQEGLPFADALALRIAQKAPFVVLDVARTESGQWKLVELNDGCQAGLNDSVDADTLYANLQKLLADDANGPTPTNRVR